MSAVIEDCKGFVHVIPSTGSGGGVGFYKMDPEIPSSGDGKVLLLGIPLAMQEIVQPSVTLDDKRALYVFGSAWSEVTVNGILLLGKSSSGGAGLKSLMSWYESNRVGKLRESVRLSIGSGAVNAYVVGLRTSDANAAINTQNFSIILLTPGTGM